MPVQECQRDGKPGYKWGEQGYCYIYTEGNEASKAAAKNKANAQGVAIIRSGGEYAAEKIGFDYDGTLSTARGKALAKNYIEKGADVYVVTARDSKDGIEFEGILSDKIFAIGSNKAKVEKVKELGLSKFYDNNPDVIKELGSTGILF